MFGAESTGTETKRMAQGVSEARLVEAAVSRSFARVRDETRLADVASRVSIEGKMSGPARGMFHEAGGIARPV